LELQPRFQHRHQQPQRYGTIRQSKVALIAHGGEIFVVVYFLVGKPKPETFVDAQ
jgi:hypothetical protein